MATNAEITNVEKIGKYAWRFTFSGTPPYVAFLNGSEVWRGEDDEDDNQLDIEDSDYEYEAPPLEVRGSGYDEDPEQITYPPFLIIQWRGTLEDGEYQIYENTGEDEWTLRMVVEEDESEYYNWSTPVLADETEHKWKVVPYAEAGNYGDALEPECFLVRNPDPPEVTISYENGVGITVSERT